MRRARDIDLASIDPICASDFWKLVASGVVILKVTFVELGAQPARGFWTGAALSGLLWTPVA